MARFYSNKNIPAQVVRELRRLGHDVLTSLEAGNANAAEPSGLDVALVNHVSYTCPDYRRAAEGK